jgi:uncharacterized protein
MGIRVALVSDTHGKVDEKLGPLFAGARYLIHAGDVCDEATLAAIVELVPHATVWAVRGNNDVTLELPPVEVAEILGVTILVAHIAEDAERELARVPQARVVICGHSHKGFVEERDGRLWVNPGGAGAKRFKLIRSAGFLEVSRREVSATLVSLEDETLPVIAQGRLGA